MQLWNRTEHGRVVADREMVQFFLDSRPVGYSIVGVSEKKKSLRLKSTLMTFTQLYYKKDVRRFDNVGRLNWSQKNTCSQVDGTVDPEVIVQNLLCILRPLSVEAIQIL